jgi:hypothetical protein
MSLRHLIEAASCLAMIVAGLAILRAKGERAIKRVTGHPLRK